MEYKEKGDDEVHVTPISRRRQLQTAIGQQSTPGFLWQFVGSRSETVKEGEDEISASATTIPYYYTGAEGHFGFALSALASW